MKERIRTGLIMAVVLLPIVFSNNLILFTVTVSILGLIGAYELTVIYKNKLGFVLTVITGLFNVLYFVFGSTSIFNALTINPLVVIIVDFLILVCVSVIKNYQMSYLYNSLLMIIYIGFGFTSLVHIYSLNYQYFIYMLLVSLGNDIFAYFCGYLFGKHKLAPQISPKKTIEGFVGGIVLGSLLGLVYFVIFMPNLNSNYILIYLLGILIALCAVLGDLFASKIKRDNGIKDFGKIFPGHGGVLDRFDSLIMCGLFYFVYFLVVL